ncbi:MAG: hypothetical protein ACK2UW_11940 [Anaerolineales bacterium]
MQRILDTDRRVLIFLFIFGVLLLALRWRELRRYRRLRRQRRSRRGCAADQPSGELEVVQCEQYRSLVGEP